MKTFCLYFLCLSTLCLLIACGGRKRTPKTQKPAVADTTVVAVVKPTINVYVENSGSMDGYVKGVTDFEHAVYSYLSDIKIAEIAESINLNYINSKIIPQDSDIAEFIRKLEPSTFAAKGGNRATTDIADVLEAILNKTDKNTVSVFISDCVFSPGSSKDAREYLITQQIGIKTDVAEQLKKHPETAYAIYRLTSQFNGTYYNCYNSPTKINDRRPFYIWVIGNVDHILALQERIPNHEFRGSGITDSHTLLPQGRKIDYYIPLSPKLGTFNFDRTNRTHITDVKKEKRRGHEGEFMFTIETNFSDLKALLDDDYLCNPDNYSVIINGQPSGAFTVSVTPKNQVSANGYTHRIQLTTTQVIPIGDIQIDLINKSPSWIVDKNDDDGVTISAEGAMDKTYGIKYLIGGVEDAYRFVFKAPEDAHQSYARINVKISK